MGHHGLGMSLKQNLKQRFRGQENSQLAVTWPSMPNEDRDAVLERLSSVIGGIRSQGSNTASDLQGLRVGVNAIVRAMESEAVAVVVVANKGVRPPVLIQHMLVVAVARHIPVVALGIDSLALGKFVGLKRLLAFAVQDD